MKKAKYSLCDGPSVLVTPGHLFLKIWPPEGDIAHICCSSPSDIHCGCGLAHSLFSKSVFPGRAQEEWGGGVDNYSQAVALFLVLCWTFVESHLQRLGDTFDWAQNISVISVHRGQAVAEKWFIRTFSSHRGFEPDHRQQHRVTILRVTLSPRKGEKHRNLFILNLFSERNADRWEELCPLKVPCEKIGDLDTLRP